MALKVKEDVQGPHQGPGQPENMPPFIGGTRGGKGQQDAYGAKIGAAGGSPGSGGKRMPSSGSKKAY